jgi:hypothetical protein
VALLGQTVLRAPDGTRWVVQTCDDGGAFVTTARRTGCDLRPAATTPSASRAAARAAHRRQVEAIARVGGPVLGRDGRAATGTPIADRRRGGTAACGPAPLPTSGVRAEEGPSDAVDEIGSRRG